MVKNKLFPLSLVFVFVIVALSVQTFAQKTNFCIKRGYSAYKRDYMSRDGRIMDPMRDNVTTSEGQSYMLLRSVIVGDKWTFNKVLNWSENNIKRKDNLFSWLWGKSASGDYKTLDYNSASDADVDIAFALVLAGEEWKNKKYIEKAVPIINSIWNKETKIVGKYRVLMPGVEQTNSDVIEVNPSYFSPYAFKFFNKYDKDHDWNKLVDSSYYYLKAVTAKTETGLPPNWFLIKDGNIVLEKSDRSDFSYDAIRVFARTYLDYIRTGEKRALPILAKSKFFIDKWKNTKTFYVNYKADGSIRNQEKFIGSIAILLPVINLFDSKCAKEIYDSEIYPYTKDKGFWDDKNNYYARNLLWFGCYFYDDSTPEYKTMKGIKIK